jgi:lambda family phage portal protein
MNSTMNIIDKIINYVMPQRALVRQRARVACELLRKFEGAAKTRRVSGWRTSGSDANTEAQFAIEVLRNRARDLVRNNPYAKRAVSGIVGNTIGTGILPKARGPAGDALNKLWASWANTRMIDADGRYTFSGLQALVMRSVVESGEVLVRRRRRRVTDNLPVPFQLQVLEPDFIDLAKEEQKLPNGGWITQGIEFNAIGKRVAYWLYDEHPGGIKWRSLSSRRVRASEILHIYNEDRPGQIHGITWYAPVMIRMRDFDEYEDAQLVRQKIAACFSVFVHDLDTTVEATEDVELIEKLEPGIVEVLPGGKTISFASPPTIEDHAEYASVTLHGIASGLNVPYEMLTSDLSQVNFTSGRMGRVEFHRSIDQWQQFLMIDQFCRPVWSWFLDSAELLGVPSGDTATKWTVPKREFVQPNIETEAIKKQVRSGFMTLPDAIMAHGHDPEEFLEEYAATNKKLDEHGIVLDTDPRRIGGGGTAQQDGLDIEGDDETESRIAKRLYQLMCDRAGSNGN